MSILASDLFTIIRAELDDDNSGRYTETDDLVPVINAAIDYLITIFNAAFDKKKISPESLRELIKVDIVNVTGTGITKRADVTTIMADLWTIFGIDPDPVTTGTDTVTLTGTSGTANISCGGLTKLATFDTDLTTTATNFVTAWATDYATIGITLTSSGVVLSFAKPTSFIIPTIVTVTGTLSGTIGVTLDSTNHRWAKRMALEEWNDVAEDPFSAGTVQSIPAEFIKAGYFGPSKIFSNTAYHILIRPAALFTAVAPRLAVYYLKNPTKVVTGASLIEFPKSISTFLVNKCLNYLSRQHGSGSIFSTVTEKEIIDLASLFT